MQKAIPFKQQEPYIDITVQYSEFFDKLALSKANKKCWAILK